MEPFFRLELVVPGSPDEVWARLWDLDRHTASVPFTRVTSSAELAARGQFIATTRLGPLVLDDRMVVEQWDPPRRAVIRKTGPVLTGTITAQLEADPGGTRVTWEQCYGAKSVPDRVAAPLRPLVAAGYRRSLRAILAP